MKKENTKIEKKENGEEAEVKITEEVTTTTEVVIEEDTEVKEAAKEEEVKAEKEEATEAEVKVEKEVATEEEVVEVVTRILTLMQMVSQLLRKDLTSLREAEVAIEVAEGDIEAEEKVVIDLTLRATEAAQDHPEEAEVKLEEKTSLSHSKLRQKLKVKNEPALSYCQTIIGVD